ncbi:MAG: PilZ domain-containing protein [Candidatus Sericytochromatia bacterium]|uniref:PilZ domain-containing protein n=1 Tax=Candidatus Tanganyikabacteria bacterium TaxID=2961651 RepID=A0A937X664_9BACT|nr:PilZ domain-containing protein [Candidatus Tanganyikabacteria bacterium]
MGTIEHGPAVSFEEGDVGEIQVTRDDMQRARCAVVCSQIEGTILEVHAASGLYNSPRRLQTRRELDLPVRYRLPDDVFRPARLRDVSAGGIGLGDMVVKGELGTTIDLELGPVSLTGSIRWQSPQKGEAGIQFSSLTSDQQMKLTQLMFSDRLLEAARSLMYGSQST